MPVTWLSHQLMSEKQYDASTYLKESLMLSVERKQGNICLRVLGRHEGSAGLCESQPRATQYLEVVVSLSPCVSVRYGNKAGI